MTGAPAPRRNVLCAVCWVDPETGQRGTNATTKLCDTCRSDPMNAGWSEQWEGLDITADAEAAARRTHAQGGFSFVAPRTLAEVDGRPPKPPTERERRILELLVHGESTAVERHDRRGRYRGRVRKHRDLSYREIAARADCSESFVRKVQHRYWK
jgi:hypothetical protein